MADLIDHIDWSSVECLNNKPGSGCDRALKQGYREDGGLVLESDTDEQLLLHVPFQQAVRLSGLIIKSTSSDEDRAPLKVKLFVNYPNIGFNEAVDRAGVEEFEMTKAQLEGEAISLRPVKFSRVNCLTIFVESNQGDADTTIIQKIAILGQTRERMDVASIKDVSKEQEK